ncbi:ATP-binding cassette domain-containing protein [Streptomyces sp. B6B3]|uniref:ATP-binding cassette domain-containing protein n=1 Tax=Streptomyces sp. B6B3 TaxID=3153570 RepID=UPI00325E6DD8
MADISMAALTKVYPGGVRALDAIDLTIGDGEFFALLGPSGCGKTTLLRTLAGLEVATGGSVGIGGRDVTTLPPGRRDVAMVFQDYALFPHMTVSDNIAYPLRIKKVSAGERRAKAAETAAELGLADYLQRRPGQLSGGQQQRAALARAMACHPKVFLFDEPLSNLDARMRLEARTFLKRLQRELGVTTVFVTHDQAEALALADRIAVMEGGRIRQLGTPAEVFRRPANTFVASFIGSTPMNLLDGVVRAAGAGEPVRVEVGDAALPAPTGLDDELAALADEKVIYGVRPEYLRYSAEPPSGEGSGALSGAVRVVENLGSAQLVTLEGPAGFVQVVVDEDAELRLGETGYAVPRADRVLVYRDGELVTTHALPADRRLPPTVCPTPDMVAPAGDEQGETPASPGDAATLAKPRRAGGPPTDAGAEADAPGDTADGPADAGASDADRAHPGDGPVDEAQEGGSGREGAP